MLCFQMLNIFSVLLRDRKRVANIVAAGKEAARDDDCRAMNSIDLRECVVAVIPEPYIAPGWLYLSLFY